MTLDRKLYTTPEAAIQLGISAGRIRQMIISGEAQPIAQIGGTWMFAREEIERLRVRPRKKRRTKQD